MKQILVVDDSSVQRKIIIQIIRQAGFNNDILEAGNGEEAIQVLGSHFKTVGLILCDWHMPEMNGIEFIEGVANVPAVANIPVVMVTTAGTEEKLKQAYSVHPNLKGYIVKPFTADKLKIVIAPFL
ncbi:MAG TPA: response regulator [Candidatus Omnitrophota bacterium]|jgi:two-component system chemotaxis response regulator CheY|nr:response regulator [Candidatus Omnitrophota bacterium]